jgi:phosphoglucomutase
VFRAETGEANQVTLARKLTTAGTRVRLLGEGSNGGVIAPPSCVRDPLDTALLILGALAKTTGRISGLLSRLPRFYTTSAFSNRAVLQVKASDHALLKRQFQTIFLREWETRRAELFSRYGLVKWDAFCYTGIVERDCTADFGQAGRGGLKIRFFDQAGPCASIWMRGSRTEPVFRVMADAETPELEAELLDWLREMTAEADDVCSRE